MTTTPLERPPAQARRQPHRYTLSAPNNPETPRIARDIVANLLRVTSRPELMDIARLLVSEIVTNVHVHTTVPSLTVETVIEEDRVLVRVTDTGPGPLAVGERTQGSGDNTDSEATGGRGLALVHAYAARWGVTVSGEGEPLGKSVWFELTGYGPEDHR